MANKLNATLGFLILALFSLSAAQAANFKVEHVSKGTYTIEITGSIERGDEKKFNDLAAKYSDAMVFLHSEGGSTLTALDIGQTIRLKGYTTAVIENFDCVSACALIWLAGSPKVLTRHARVGFHASYIDDRGKLLESGVGNALVGRYLTLLNLSERVVVFATLAPPNKLNWLTAENYEQVGIETKILDVDLSEDSTTTASNTKQNPQIKSEDSSKEVEWWSKVGIWSIGIDRTLGDSCFMLAIYKSGTAFRIGFNAQDNFSSYFMVGNDRWASLKPNEEYQLELKLGNNTPWTVPAVGVDMSGSTMLMASFTEADFWKEFIRSENILIGYNEKVVADLPLDNSDAAFRQLYACQKQQEKSNDPFSGGSSSDPFK